MTIYILKTQGTDKIPDYVQIRDENFRLKAYFKAKNPKRALEKCNLIKQSHKILEVIDKIPYGKIEKVEL